MRVVVFGRRELIMLQLTETDELLKLGRIFAVLLSAAPNGPTWAERRIVETSVASGCVELCCVGAGAENLHDYIDEVLEERGLVNVVTTWHTDESMEDALHYFLHLAGSSPPTLVAVVEDEPGLLVALSRQD
jgi:hypothetical protein